MVRRDSKVYSFANSFLFVDYYKRSGLLAGIRWSVYILKSHRSLCASFSRTGAGLCVFFTSVYVDGLWLKFVLLQVSSCCQDSLCLNNEIVWMVSTRFVVSKFFSPFFNHMMTTPKLPITVSIHVTFIFYSFLNYLARSRYSSFFSLSFNFTPWSAVPARSTTSHFIDDY